MDLELQEKLISWADKYNDPIYFQEDPIAFPSRFAKEYHAQQAVLQDVEIAALFSAHLAWGRRAMIVRDCNRLFDEMNWHPYEYVMNGQWRDDKTSLHRTIKWNEIASICSRLQRLYGEMDSLESLDASDCRTEIFGSKPDKKAPNKKINMMRRWMIRDDGKVDLGLWKNSSKEDLIIPLDVHVYTQAAELGLTSRKSKDIVTAMEITDAFRDIFPGDPCKGDFALFGHGVTQQ